MRALMGYGADRHFLFSTIGDNYVYGWHNGTTSIYSHFTAPVLYENVVWIINQSEHGQFHAARCRKVLIVSTDDSHSKQFKSSAGSFLRVVHMPLPTEAEARAAAAAHGVADEDIDTRIR